MKKFIVFFLACCVLGINSCSDDDYPVPPASTVPKFTVTLSNNEFAPALATFSNTSIVPARAREVSYLWNFGDGSTSSEENPMHLYEEPGVYAVNLVVISTSSLEINEYKQNVVVKDPNAGGLEIFFTNGTIVYGALINDQAPVPQALGLTAIGDSYGMVIDTLNDKLYVADFDEDKIFVSNLDGSGQFIFRSGVGPSDALAIDYDNNMLYWDTAEGIRRTSLSNLSSFAFEDFVTGQAALDPEGIAIDMENDVVYWNTYEGGIWKKNINGTGQAEIIPGIGGGSIILVGNKIYYDTYIEADDTRIRSANLDGSGVATLATGVKAVVFGMAYDYINDKIYWSDRDDNLIIRADLDGSNPETWATVEGRGIVIGKEKVIEED
jgi:hypothetical protein